MIKNEERKIKGNILREGRKEMVLLQLNYSFSFGELPFSASFLSITHNSCSSLAAATLLPPPLPPYLGADPHLDAFLHNPPNALQVSYSSILTLPIPSFHYVLD